MAAIGTFGWGLRLATQGTLTLGVLAIVATAAHAEKPEWDPVLAEMGAERFETHCSACHGADARGDGPVAAVLKTPPSDLTRIAARRNGEFPAGEIGRFIDGRFSITAHGTREMPVWGTAFSASIPEPGAGDEIARGIIATLLEFLKSIQRE
jgi:mono/diheme cytochrome c family protein